MPTELGKRELSLCFEWWQKKENDLDLWKVPRVNLFYGIIENLSGEIALPFLFRVEKDEKNSGIGDTELGLKWLIKEETLSIPAFVLGLEVGLPTGDEKKELGEGEMECKPFLALFKDVVWVIIQGNIGYSLAWNEEQEKEIEYNLALAFPLAKNWLLFAELNGSRNLEEKENEIYLAPAVKYEIKEGIGLGIGLPVGLTDESFDQGVVIKTMFEF